MVSLWFLGYIDLFFSDESGFNLNPTVPYAWQKKGKKIRILAKKGKKRLNVLGFLNLNNHLHVYPTEGTIDADFVKKSTNDFITQRQKSTSDCDKPIVIVWDNSPVHHANMIKDELINWENKQNCYFFFLPTYSPHLNPIEILWRMVKYKWIKKENYKSWNKLKKAILKIFKNFGVDCKINFNKFTQNNLSFNSA